MPDYLVLHRYLSERSDKYKAFALFVDAIETILPDIKGACITMRSGQSFFVAESFEAILAELNTMDERQAMARAQRQALNKQGLNN